MKAKRKLLGVMAALVLSTGVSVSAYAWARVKTSCGTYVNTVDQRAFETYGDGEWMDYMADLNEDECGMRYGTMRYQEIR